MRLFLLAAALLLCAPSASASQSTAAGSQPTAPVEQGNGKQKLTDAQVKQILIDESVASYAGNCPCPYSTMSNGRRCGRRSAYSRAGGEAPLCYPKDVTPEMIQAYREANPG